MTYHNVISNDSADLHAVILKVVRTPIFNKILICLGSIGRAYAKFDLKNGQK